MPTYEELLAQGGQPAPAPAGGGGGLTYDQIIAQGGAPPEAAPAPAAEEPGGGISTLRGAFQGVTLGFGDELSGLVRSLVNGTSYQEERDAARGANKAAQEAHPFLYGGGELAGGLAVPIPGLGAAKTGVSLGAKLAAHAAEGAAAGSLAGLGSSEADLTKGDFGGAVHDVVESAIMGGAIGTLAGGAGHAVGKLGEHSEDLAVKALAGGESKTSGAAWQKTKRMVNNPETKRILGETVNVEGATTTLAKVAGKEPAVIQDVVDAQVQKIGSEIRPIYAQADAKNGGVKLSDYIKHLDERIAATADMAPAEAKVYKGAINELKENAIEQWGARNGDLQAALGSEEAKNPQARQAIMKAMDVRIPSDEVRAEATALQKIGFKTVDPLNPGLQTQVKRDMGNMVRDFVNQHVMQTLGPESHGQLLSLNKRMNAWLGVGTVAAARAEKEAAGRMSLGGTAHKLLGHGSLLGVGMSLAHGNVPAAAAAYALPKVIEHLPAATRGAASAVARADARLKAVADAAAGGNAFAAHLLQTIRQAPGGAARLAALQVVPPSPPEASDAPAPIQE